MNLSNNDQPGIMSRLRRIGCESNVRLPVIIDMGSSCNDGEDSDAENDYK